MTRQPGQNRIAKGGTRVHELRAAGTGVRNENMFAKARKEGMGGEVELGVCDSAPAEFPTQRLGPGHCKIACAHRDSALDHHLGPIPPPPTPTPTKFEPPTFTVAAGFPPKVARHP